MGDGVCVRVQGWILSLFKTVFITDVLHCFPFLNIALNCHLLDC